MERLLPIFLVICIMMGFANVVMSYLVSIKYNNQLSKCYLWLTVFLLMDNGVSILVVHGIGYSGTPTRFYLLLLANVLFTLIAYTGYVLIVRRLNLILFDYIKMPKLFWQLLMIIYLLEIVFLVTQLEHFGEWRFWYNLVVFVMYGLILAMLILDLVNMKRMKAGVIKDAINKVLPLLLLVFVLMIIENIAFSEVVYMGPLLFLVLNGVGILYTIKLLSVSDDQLIHKEALKLELAIKENGITEREVEIIQLVLNAYTNKEIAESLFIAEGTVKNHLYNIYKKLEVRNRSELISHFKTP